MSTSSPPHFVIVDYLGKPSNHHLHYRTTEGCGADNSQQQRLSTLLSRYIIFCQLWATYRTRRPDSDAYTTRTTGEQSQFCRARQTWTGTNGISLMRRNSSYRVQLVLLAKQKRKCCACDTFDTVSKNET
nr:hypothetical protein BgiMline_027858 [Biomphalaria glabrata]